ncbi:MAG: SH3 domain-containing protein [Alphaproteobacteria bacterium]
MFAQSATYQSSGLPIPRFVSLSKDEVNVRAGPGKQYPVKWVMMRKGLPVEVVLEFEHWRKVKDHEGQEGWVYHTLLSGKRTALILGDDNVAAYEKETFSSNKKVRINIYLEPFSKVNVEKCVPQSCLVSAVGYSGWVERKSLWGVYEHENID